jgi:hypothetical protein
VGIKWLLLGNEIGGVELWKHTHRSVFQLREKQDFLPKINVGLG